MKKTVAVVSILMVAMLGAAPALAQQAPQAAPGPWGYGNRFCPNCGAYQGPGGWGMGPGMGPGMMGYGAGPGMMGPGMGPGMMGYGAGPGMMGSGAGPGTMGYGAGPGMMGPGMGPGMMGYGAVPGMMGPMYGPAGQQVKLPLDEEGSKSMVENYLAMWRNPNLKLGKMEDKGSFFEAEIVTKDNSLVEKIQIDKNSGWMRPVR